MRVKVIQSIEDSKRHLKIAKYLLDFTLRLMEDNRLLSKSLVELQMATTKIIDASVCLYGETGRIIPNGKEGRAHLFFKKAGRKYLSKKELGELEKVLLFAKRHKTTHLEFVRKDKLVIFGREKCRVLTEQGLRNTIEIMEKIISKIMIKAEGINIPLNSELFEGL